MSGCRLAVLGPVEFARLAKGEAPQGLRLPATPLAPPDVLEMLAGIAARVGETFQPCAWMAVAGDTVVALVSQTREPEAGALTIGYGVAPGEQRRGHATAAVRALQQWAATDGRVRALVAETTVANQPSQRVLAANDFAEVGRRDDPEDGPLICWRWSVPS